MDMPLFDFTVINTKKRKLLFYKRPKGAAIPVGVKWRCICAMDNILSDQTDQYCKGCGSRLRLQENAEASSTYNTLVIVSHFTPDSPR